jgi:hypothetical protein
MSNVFNWIIEPPLEYIIRPSPESKQPVYYTPPAYLTFYEKNIKNLEVGKPIEVQYFSQVLKRYISSLMAMFSISTYNVEIYEDSFYGRVARITTDLSAKEALELWLKLLDYLPYEKYNTVLSVRWLGKNNVSESELIDYLVKIMIKSKVRPRALPGFDSVRMVQELRE